MLHGLLMVRESAAARDAQVEAARGAARAGAAEEHAKRLEDRLDKLTLVCMGIWELLRERAKLTEQDLMDKVREIDIRDGVPDGKVTPQVAQCPKCSRVMSPRHKKCLYCGSEWLNLTAFDETL